jgi:hypothetical protein
MARETHQWLTAGKHTPERCLNAAFRFLLDREPKESILKRFDVRIIGRYFPEFERELPRYLAEGLISQWAAYGFRNEFRPLRMPRPNATARTTPHG